VSVPILFREAEVVHNPFVGAFYSALVLAFCMLELPIYIYRYGHSACFLYKFEKGSGGAQRLILFIGIKLSML